MAERRMFTKKIIDSDAFLDMPLSTQALYFHLNMRADDDGFINNPKKICRMIGSSEDDLKLLITKRFVLAFDNGVIVIKHWRMHNLIRKDRYCPTQYEEQKELLEMKENGSYTERLETVPCIEENTVATNWQPSGNQVSTQVRLGKDSLDKDSLLYIVEYLNEKAGTKYKSSTKKTQSCIRSRLKEGFTVDDFKTVIDKKCTEWIGTEFEPYLRPETLFGPKFESYLNAKERKPGQSNGNKTAFNNFNQRSYDYEAIERMITNQQNPPETSGTNEDIRRRAEELQKRLGG